jgi:ubiquinone/menaquinone biosynthesis C-methylase UbiE
MNSPADQPGADLKRDVQQYWNAQSCDTQVARSEKFTRAYFDEIEAFRYYDQPFIHSFAQFTRYHGKRVLEVGFGAGTDFIQWVRAGATVSGIDLTDEALANVRHRIAQYALPQPEHLATGDAENLPFADGSFDLGYSFGVLHHSPNTEKALSELVRVIRPGGELKIMLYNRRSIYVLNRWVRFALLKGKPFHDLRWVLWNHVESINTKGYTRSELREWFRQLPLEDVHVHTHVTAGDWLSSSAFKPLNWCYRAAMKVAGYSYPWRPEQYVARVNDAEPAKGSSSRMHRDPNEIVFMGNPLGFYHCITARKRG